MTDTKLNSMYAKKDYSQCDQHGVHFSVPIQSKPSVRFYNEPSQLELTALRCCDPSFKHPLLTEVSPDALTSGDLQAVEPLTSSSCESQEDPLLDLLAFCELLKPRVGSKPILTKVKTSQADEYYSTIPYSCYVNLVDDRDCGVLTPDHLLSLVPLAIFPNSAPGLFSYSNRYGISVGSRSLAYLCGMPCFAPKFDQNTRRLAFSVIFSNYFPSNFEYFLLNVPFTAYSRVSRIKMVEQFVPYATPNRSVIVQLLRLVWPYASPAIKLCLSENVSHPLPLVRSEGGVHPRRDGIFEKAFYRSLTGEFEDVGNDFSFLPAFDDSVLTIINPRRLRQLNGYHLWRIHREPRYRKRFSRHRGNALMILRTMNFPGIVYIRSQSKIGYASDFEDDIPFDPKSTVRHKRSVRVAELKPLNQVEAHSLCRDVKFHFPKLWKVFVPHFLNSSVETDSLIKSFPSNRRQLVRRSLHHDSKTAMVAEIMQHHVTKQACCRVRNRVTTLVSEFLADAMTKVFSVQFPFAPELKARLKQLLQAVKLIESLFNYKNAKRIVFVLSQLLALYMADGLTRCALLFSFLFSEDLHDLIGVDALTEVKNFFMREQTFDSFKKSVSDSDLISKLMSFGAALLGSVFMAPFVKEGVVPTFFKYVMNVVAEVNVVGSAYDFCTAFLEKCTLFFQTRDPSVFIGLSKRDSLLKKYSEFTEKTRFLSLSRTLWKDSSGVETTISPRILLAEARELSASINVYLLKVRDYELSLAATALAAAVMMMRNSLDSVRQQPAGILLTGPPGCGKTILASRIGAILKKRHGLAPEENVNFVFSSTKYQTPVPCALVVTVDDIFTKVAEREEPAQDFISMSTNLCNTTAFKFEYAEVTDKGLHSAPEVVFFTTNLNNRNFNVSEIAGLTRLDRRVVPVIAIYSTVAVNLSKTTGVSLDDLRRENPLRKDLVWFVVTKFKYHGVNVSWALPEGFDALVMETKYPDLLLTEDQLLRFIVARVDMFEKIHAKFQIQTELPSCAAGFDAHDSSVKCVCRKLQAADDELGELEEEEDLPIPTEEDLCEQVREMIKSRKSRWPDMPSDETEDPNIGTSVSSSDLLPVWAERPHRIHTPPPPSITEKFWSWWGRASEESTNCMKGVYVVLETGLTSAVDLSYFRLNATKEVCIAVGLVSFLVAGVYSYCATKYIMRHLVNERVKMLMSPGKFSMVLPDESVIYAEQQSFESKWLKENHGLLRFEGQTVSTLVNPPDSPKDVREFIATPNGWLKINTGPPCEVSIRFHYEVSGKSKYFQVQATSIGPSAFITVRHFWVKMLDLGINEYILIHKGKQHRLPLDKKRVSHDPDGRDLSFFTCDLSFLDFAPYAKFRKEPRSGVITFKGHSVKCEITGNQIFHDAPSEDGDCGKPILDSEGYTLGIHHALITGSSYRAGVAISEYLVLSMSRQFLLQGAFMPLVDDSVPTMFVGEELGVGLAKRSDAAYVQKNGNMPEAFRVCGHLPFRNNQKFTAHPTEMHDVFCEMLSKKYGAPTQTKAVEFEGVWHSAVTRKMDATMASEKRTSPNPYAMNLAMETLIRQLPVPSEKLGFLSFTQAVCGDKRNSFMTPRDNSKSLGATLRSKGLSNSNAYRHVVDNTFEVHTEILDDYTKLKNLKSETGRIPLTVVSANFKDEVLSEAKIEKGKIRLYYVGDHVDHLEERVLLAPLVSYLQENASELGIASAINCCGSDWGAASKKLSRSGLKYFRRFLELDNVAFDCSLDTIKYYVIVVLLTMARKCGYSQHEIHEISIALGRSLNYLLMMEGNIFWLAISLPSGYFITYIMNCIANLISRYYAFALAKCLSVTFTRPVGMPFDEELVMRLVSCDLAGWYPSEVVSPLAGGDDSVQGVCDEFDILPSFIVSCDASLGLVTTDGAKTGSLPTFKRLEDVTFLKRKFKNWEGLVLAPLELDSIYKALCYCCGVKKDKERERNINVLFNTNRELFMHGREVVRHFQERAGSIPWGPRLETFDEMHELYLAGSFKTWLDLRVETFTLDQARATASWATAFVEDPKLKYESSRGGGSRNLPYLYLTEINSTNTTLEVASAAPTLPSMDSESFPPAHYNGQDDIPMQTTFGQFVQLPNFTLGVGPMFGGTSLYTQYQATIAQSFMSPFRFVKWDSVTVKFWYTGNSSMFGAYRISFYPGDMCRPGDQQGFAITQLETPGSNAAARYPLPGLVLDVSKPCECEITLPWPCPSPFIIAGPSGVEFNDYYVSVDRLASIQTVSGGTPPVLILKTMVRYNGLKMGYLRNQGLEESPGAFSRAVAFGSNIVSTLFSYVSPAMHVARVGLKVAQAMGFSRPVVIPDHAIGKVNYSLSNGSGGPTIGQHLSIDPAQAISMDLTIPFSQEGETKAAWIASRPGLLVQGGASYDTFSVSTNQFLHYGSTISMSPFQFATTFYRYWRGTICVKLIWYASPLMRARFLIFVGAPGQGAPSSSYSDAQENLHVVDVCGTTEYVIKVPFARTKEVSLCRSNIDDLQFRIVNESDWIVPGVNSITNHPMIEYWCEDFEGEVAMLNYPVGYSLQGGFGGEDDGDLLLHTRKRNFVLALHTDGLGNIGRFSLPAHFPHVNGVLGGVDNQFGTLGVSISTAMWLSTAYFGVCGGSVYDVIPNGGYLEDRMIIWEANDYSVGSYLEDDNRAPGMTTYTLPYDTRSGVAIVEQNNSREVVVPDRHPYRFRCQRYGLIGGVFNPPSSMVCRDLTTNPSVEYQIFHGANDDFRVGGWLCPPTLKTQVA